MKYITLDKEEFISYLDTAEDQFLNLREEVLDENRHSLGGSSDEWYDLDGFKFNIAVDGFWEKATWCNYKVTDIDGNILEEDHTTIF